MGDMLSDAHIANEEVDEKLERYHQHLMVALSRVIPPDSAQQLAQLIQKRRDDLDLSAKKALIEFAKTAWPQSSETLNTRVTCPDCAAILEIVDGSRLKFIKHQC